MTATSSSSACANTLAAQPPRSSQLPSASLHPSWSPEHSRELEPHWGAGCLPHSGALGLACRPAWRSVRRGEGLAGQGHAAEPAPFSSSCVALPCLLPVPSSARRPAEPAGQTSWDAASGPGGLLRFPFPGAWTWLRTSPFLGELSEGRAKTPLSRSPPGLMPEAISSEGLWAVWRQPGYSLASSGWGWGLGS